MLHTQQGDDDITMNVAGALNAPPAFSVVADLESVFSRAVENLRANEVAEIATQFGVKKARSKKDTISNLLTNMKDRLSTVEVWSKTLTIRDLNRMAASGALGQQVGEIVRLERRSYGMEDDAWNATSKFASQFRVKIGESKWKKANGKIETIDEIIDSRWNTEMRIIPTTKKGFTHRSNAVGIYDHENMNPTNNPSDRETPQMHHTEWRLQCFSQYCRTPSGVTSFVRGVGMGANIHRNPALDEEGRADVRFPTPPLMLWDSKNRPVVLDTEKARRIHRCPTCSGRVRWGQRLAGGYSSSLPVGGWGCIVKLPSEKNRTETGRVQSNQCVNVEMNNRSPRISTTFDELEGCLPYGLNGQGWNQRHGYEPNSEAFTYNKDGSKKGKRKTIHLPCSIQRRIGIVQTASGAEFPVLFWAAIHDLNGDARGIDDAPIETVLLMLRIVQRYLKNGSTKAMAGSDLLDFVNQTF